ncbi:class I adenylate-forming enzyme family protein [Halospeciosus flavus]|uniref:class I adenylate-forming enzyme family protein n=1 Tax=Halospeciosus flavus TaxID=3032283 RepID=UPI00361CCB23
MTPGYDDPDQTAEAFGPYGFHTGDVGYVDEAGKIHVLNRRSDRIITGGENVHPGEVVDVLRSHPDVETAAVVGVEDPEWGERVAALVVPAEDTESADESGLTADDVRAYCRDRLAGYKVPRTVVFVDSLPRTASGTVDRAAARERVAQATDL